MKRKGIGGWSTQKLVGLIAVLAIGLAFLGFIIPAVNAAEDATGCDGAMRAISSAISSTLDEQIC